MKFKNLLLIIILFFFSCETDFDVNAEWDEVTVVYALIDPNNEDQFIKINKAFLGQGDAFEMASIADSTNYDPSNLLVKIHKLKEMPFNTFDSIGDPKILNYIILEKDTGLFSYDNNIIYTFNDTTNSYFNSSDLYALEIRNLKTGNIVTSQTKVIDFFSFQSLNTSFAWSFFNPDTQDTSKFLQKTLKWDPVTNGEIYQLDVIINYRENGNIKHLLWRQPIKNNSNTQMTQTLKGEQFFQFLINNLNNNTSKQFIDLNLVMSVGTQDLKTYIDVNQPYSGIVQERPNFSNIENGIGLFSSRFIYDDTKGIRLNDNTLNYIRDSLYLGFE